MKKYLLLIVAILVIGFTTWVSAPQCGYPLNGMSQAMISDKYPTAITPAGFTFSIWSIIYLSWILVGAMRARLPYTAATKKIAPKIGDRMSGWLSPRAESLYMTAMILTAVWLIPWSYDQIGVSLLIMLILLGVLKALFAATRDASQLVRRSVEIFVGWINIATIANITVFLVSIGFYGGGIAPTIWASVIIIAAFFITMRYQLRYHAHGVSLVYLWAMLGIYVAHTDVTERAVVVATSILLIIAMISTCKKTA